MKKQKFFDSTVELFETYKAKMDREKPDGYNSSLAHEVSRRLKQLSFLCNKIRLYEKRFDKIGLTEFGISSADIAKAKMTGVPVTSAFSRKDFDAFTNLLFEIELFAESFYFVAWRICSIFKHKRTNTLPYLNTFEAKGIRDVRNSLIEHPEDSQIFRQSFMCGGDQGPVLKNARSAGDPYEICDKGLWVNAKEFRDNLEKLLRQAVED